MRFAAKGLLVFCFFASCMTPLRAQDIQIKLVDGKTGRAVKGDCVGIWMKQVTNTDSDRPTDKNDVDIPTDKNGVSWLRLTQKDNEVNISHNRKLGCGAYGAINPVLKYNDSLRIGPTLAHPSCAFPESMPLSRFKEIDFLTNEVIERGVVSANTCGKVTVSPQPGQIILFVRPRNHQEKVYDWQNSDAFPF